MVANGNATLLTFIDSAIPPPSYPVEPSTSPYESLCAQIAADLGAMSPPDNTAIVYLRNNDEEIDIGASNDRTFHFQWVESKKVAFQGSYIRLREICELVIFVAGGRHNVRTFDEALRNEAVTIAQQIDYRETWPSGVSHVNCVGAKARGKGTEDAELVITITFESQNSRPIFGTVL